MQVLTLEVDLGTGQRGQTLAVLQRCSRNNVLNSLDGRVNFPRIERGQSGLGSYDIGRVRHSAIFARPSARFPSRSPILSG